MKFRKEFDSIGFINVPNDKYWGASTQRSKKYFDIGEFLVRPILIKSIAIIKKAAARVHIKEKSILPNISKANSKIKEFIFSSEFPGTRISCFSISLNNNSAFFSASMRLLTVEFIT